MLLALRIESLWKSYVAGVRGCSARVWVLRGLSLTLVEGERVAIVGAAGAGKSTLVSCILGLRAPDAGLVEAPALATQGLAILGPGPWLERREIPAARDDTLLLVVDDLARVRGPVDRVLRLRDGRLHRLDDRTPARAVAERALAGGTASSLR